MINCHKCTAFVKPNYCNKYKTKLKQKFKHSPLKPCEFCLIEKGKK